MERKVWLSMTFFLLISISLLSKFSEEQALGDGIEISKEWEGLPIIYEDDTPHYINVTGGGGMFEDYNIEDLMIWNQDLENWSTYNNTGIFNVSAKIFDKIWTIVIAPLPDQSGSSKVIFNISQNGTHEEFTLEIDVEPVNDPPYLGLPSVPVHWWRQFENYSLTPYLIDPDVDDLHLFEVNFNTPIETGMNITDQLPYYTPEKGVDWDLDNTTGTFWWNLTKQEIWKTDSGMVNELTIEIILRVTDSGGESSTIHHDEVLLNVNEPPETPSMIHIQGDQVYESSIFNLWVDPVRDPDEDKLIYRWDLGDGSTAEGISVNHTYEKKGNKTVQMWVSDGEYETQKIHVRIEVLDNPEYLEEDDDIVSPYETGDEDYLIVILILIGGFFLILIMLILVFIFVSRKNAFSKYEFFKEE